MKTQNMFKCIMIISFLFCLSACGTSTSDRALSGGAIGAGVGAVGSSALGGSPWTGAAVGGAVGAATGALTKKK
jgi:osmotically inducible lipoprotein OsmB